MSNSSQFFGSAPVGSIIQAPWSLTDPNYLPCDGRKLSRASYPALSACAGAVGTFTSTHRGGRAGLPGTTALTADATNYVLAMPLTANSVQTSPDGITWTSRAVGFDVYNLGSDGVNMIATGGGASAYSINSGVSWTTSASAIGSSSQGSLAYASSIGANGRWIQTDGSSVNRSDDRGVTWAASALPSSGGGSCWTGTKYIVGLVGANIATSSDGISWTVVKPMGGRGIFTRPVSDGSGRVACWDSVTGVLWYSTDHGVTWAFRAFGAQWPTDSALTPGRLQGAAALSCTNGRFFLCFGAGSGNGYTDANIFCSSDLATWVAVPDVVSLYSGGTPANTMRMIHKAGVYWVNDLYAAGSGLTLVENTDQLCLPTGFQGAPGGAAPSGYNNYQPFIRVK